MPTLQATLPYPWPYDGCLDPARLALIITGAQSGWIEASNGSAEVAQRITVVREAMRSAGCLIVLVHHAGPARGQPSPFPPAVGTDAADLAVSPEPGDLIIRAGGIDGFHASPLDDELRSRDIDHLVFAGFGAEASVDSTQRSANDRGYECLTLTDAVAPFSADLGQHVLSSITMSGGIFGAIGPSAALVAALSALSDRDSPVPVEAP